MKANELHFLAARPDADTLASFDADGHAWRWCDGDEIEAPLVVVFHRDVRTLIGGICTCFTCGETDTEAGQC